MDLSKTFATIDRLAEENAKLKDDYAMLKDAYEQAVAENKDLRKAHEEGYNLYINGVV